MNTNWRNAISPAERFLITLRYQSGIFSITLRFFDYSLEYLVQMYGILPNFCKLAFAGVMSARPQNLLVNRLTKNNIRSLCNTFSWPTCKSKRVFVKSF